MIFYTDVFGLAASIVGTLTLATRIIDAFTDVLMGFIIDHTHSRWGKCRPYFLFGAIPFAIVAIATFTVPPFGMKGKIIYACITYIALSCAYTVVNIPLTAILPSLTTDGKERTILVSVRMVFAFIGSTLVTTFTVPLVQHLGGSNSAKGYFITMVLYAVIAAILFFVTFKTAEEKVQLSSSKEKISIKQDLKSINGTCILFFLWNLFYFLLLFVKNSAIMYYFTYNLQRVDLVPIVGALGLASILILFILPAITNRIGKRNTMIMGSVIHILGCLLIYYFSHNIQLILSGVVIINFGGALMQGIVFAVSPDTIDYTEYKKGKNISGIISALQGFVAKIGMGISGALVGWLLTRGGYVANQVQSDSALFSISLCFIWIPVICCIAIIIIALFYKLDKKMPEIQNILENRRQAVENI
jgi:GPH family glycoside/pentoside/hexuronide:cation symporter